MKDFTMNSTQLAQTNRQVDMANKQMGTKKAGGEANLGKDSFLKLLVTQLQHQDPTKPMEDREFISQMAQFTSLEQMTNMNRHMEKLLKSNESSKAHELLGKHIDAYDPSRKKRVSGTVDSVIFAADKVKLKVGEQEISMEHIHAIHNNSSLKGK